MKIIKVDILINQIYLEVCDPINEKHTVEKSISNLTKGEEVPIKVSTVEE